MFRFLISIVIGLLSAGMVNSCENDATNPEPPLVNKVYFDTGLSVQAGQKFTVGLYFDNSVPIRGITVPLWYSGDHVRCDSVSFRTSRVANWQITKDHVDSVEQWINIGVVDPSAAGIETGRGLLATLFFWTYGNTPTVDMVIDTFPIPPGAQLRFQDTSSVSTNSFVPQFTPASVHIEAFP